MKYKQSFSSQVGPLFPYTSKASELRQLRSWQYLSWADPTNTKFKLTICHRHKDVTASQGEEVVH